MSGGIDYLLREAVLSFMFVGLSHSIALLLQALFDSLRCSLMIPDSPLFSSDNEKKKTYFI